MAGSKQEAPWGLLCAGLGEVTGKPDWLPESSE